MLYNRLEALHQEVAVAFVVFVAPFWTESALRMIEATASLVEVRLGVISQDPLEHLPPALAGQLVAHWRVDNSLDTAQVIWAARSLADHYGPIDRLFGAAEHLQLQLAETRAELGIPGLSVEAALNFRDKARMKTLLRNAGLPCARHCLAESAAHAWEFISAVGYPVVVKPPAGAGAEGTARVENDEQMHAALLGAQPAPAHPLLIEEFITGQEHSFDTLSLDGRPVFHSLTRYRPSALEVMNVPWVQWCVMLPREVDAPQYDDIRTAAFRALEVLGMGTGMSHMEWFRRRDGSIAISEVAARPPGAQFTTLIARAHDVDLLQIWARLMIFGEFEPISRRYAAGIAFLRGMGNGHVVAVHGLDEAQREVGALVTDVKLPTPGQPSADGYEGEGYVIVRHPETAVVEQALERIISLVRVQLG